MTHYIDPCPGTPSQPDPDTRFKLEAVIVCDKYADFLRVVLPANKHIFDRIVVVTSYEDRATQKVCEYNHVECLRSDLGESRKGHFKKGAMINVGLDALSKEDWVFHLDGDMLLPPQTRILFERAHLDKGMVYGIDRFNVKGYDKWEEFNETPRLQHECDAYIHLDAFPIGTRIMSAAGDGFIPIGFTQIWNPRVSKVFRYPEGHTDAGREDMLFAKQWPRAKRGFIPEIIGYHLESEDSVMMANWGGRKTAPFRHATGK